MRISRQDFLKVASGAAAYCCASPVWAASDQAIQFGLVTYLWGQDWDLPTLIRNCEAAGVLGVELRTTHAHAVEPTLNSAERREVKERFDDSPVVHVGIGSNERFDDPDPAVVRKAIDATNAFTRLSHDTGGSGVKVKPDRFHDGIDRERTIDQIAKSLDAVGAYAQDYGQEIRLEMHGQCAAASITRDIMERVTESNVKVCWNSNDIDLEEGGVAANFALVRRYFGATVHVRELNTDAYPYALLTRLLAESNYTGWILLEARGAPADRVAALIEQREIFQSMMTEASHNKE